MSIFAVTYEYDGTEDVLAQHRPAHREYLGGLADRGAILGSGPYVDQQGPGALLIISAGSAEEAEEMIANDPLVVHGAVTGRTMREWSIKTGPWSSAQ